MTNLKRLTQSVEIALYNRATPREDRLSRLCVARNSPRRLSPGFSLIEMLVVVVVLSVVLAMAVPTFSGIIERDHLKNAAQQLRSDINLAKTESRRRNRNVSVSFTRNDDGDAWCYGFTFAAECDCTADAGAEMCWIDIDPSIDPDDPDLDNRIRSSVSSDRYQGVTLDALPFAGGDLLFSAARPTLSAGSASFTSANEKTARVVVSSMGRLRLCSPAGDNKLYSYDPC